jgi:hypothetical protein
MARVLQVEFGGLSVVQSRPPVENDCLTENIVKHRTPVSPAVSLSLVVVSGFSLYFAASTLLPLRPALAQEDAAPAADAPAAAPAAGAATDATPAADATVTTPAVTTPAVSAPVAPGLSEGRMRQASWLISEALTVAERNSEARIVAARGAAGLIPRLNAATRGRLPERWIRLVETDDVPPGVRTAAYSTFFDVASREDADFALRTALALPDAAARAGAFIDLSEAAEKSNWSRANEYVMMARQAARREDDPSERARALTFVAYRAATLNPDVRAEAVTEASSAVRSIGDPGVRDYLLADVAGAAAKFNLGLARKIAGDISDEKFRNLAQARANISEASQTTLTTTTSDRIAALAKAAAPYDMRAVPILLQLPPQTDVLKTLADALPPIYPSARPAIDASLLERMWTYAGTAEPSVYRDQLQSRLARLMVLHDLWRGRDWGKQLAWKGGRIQVGAFLKSVLESRQSRVRAMPLHEVAKRNINRAILQARTLPPAGRVEALLLIAGQILA